MRSSPAAALLALTLAAPAGATDPSRSPGLPAVLTLDDALRIAREHAPDRALAEAGVATARAQVQSAGALPNPVVSFLAGWSSQCGDPGCDRTAFVAGLGDQGAIATLVTGQRGLAVDAAEQGLVGAESSRRDVLRDLDFQVKQQFVTTAVAARMVRFSREETAIAEQALQAARQRRSASGSVSASDVTRLEVLHGQIEQLAGRADQAFAQARASLARLLGFRADAATFAVDPGPASIAVVPPRLSGATVASLTADARAARPDLAAARALLEQARLQASLQRRLVIPAVQLQAQYAQQGSAGAWFTPPTASVGLTIPLPVLYQRQGEIGQADAAVLGAEAMVNKVESQVLADVATAFANLQAYRKNAERSRERVLPRARSARDQVAEQYAKGTASLLDYLDAQRSFIHSEMDDSASLGDFWTAVFQVERAVGASYHP
jgi:cobalt-zinc-cadmium efflux system outer membrane protein